jgi:hypothetical protein
MMTSTARNRLDRAIRAVDQAVLFDLQLCISAYFEQVAATNRETLKQVTQRLSAGGSASGTEAMIAQRAEARRGNGPAQIGSQRTPSSEAEAPSAASNGTIAPGPADAPTKLDA